MNISFNQSLINDGSCSNNYSSSHTFYHQFNHISLKPKQADMYAIQTTTTLIIPFHFG